MEPGNSYVGTAALGCPAWPQARLDSIHVHEHESCRIPDLVGKGAIAIRSALAERYVRPRRSHGSQREARGIRAEAFDDIERIDYVALRLRHLLALGIAHQRVNVNLPEGNAVVLFIRPAAGLFDRGILFVPLHEVASEHDH